MTDLINSIGFAINDFVIQLNASEKYPPEIPGNGEITTSILPNVWVFAAHIVATIILLTFIICMVWKPTKKYLEKRKNKIMQDVNEANQKNIEANKNYEISKKELLESKETASAIIQKATIEGETIKSKMEKTALNRINHLEKEADAHIKKQEELASLKINKEASILALDVAEIFLGEKVNSTENQKMVDSIIKNLEKENKVAK